MTIMKIAVLLGLISTGSVAMADTTAVYKTQSKANSITMTVEIADNANLRYEMSTGGPYGLVLNGVDYFVDLSTGKPVVDRVDDLVAAQKEAMAAFMSKFKKHAPVAGPLFVSTGEVTINGRSGQAFGYKLKNVPTDTPVLMFNPHPELSGFGKTTDISESEGRRALARTVVVISHDPDLAQLGKAMAKQFGTSTRMLTGMMGSTPDTFRQMQELLESGAPLSFGGMELLTVNHTPIDPKRFELPAQPETVDEIGEKMKRPTKVPLKP